MPYMHRYTCAACGAKVRSAEKLTGEVFCEEHRNQPQPVVGTSHTVSSPAPRRLLQLTAWASEYGEITQAEREALDNWILDMDALLDESAEIAALRER